MHWDFCDFKSFDYHTSFMVVDVDSAVVETSQKPRFCGVEIDAFDVIQPIIIIISKSFFCKNIILALVSTYH